MVNIYRQVREQLQSAEQTAATPQISFSESASTQEANCVDRFRDTFQRRIAESTALSTSELTDGDSIRWGVSSQRCAEYKARIGYRVQAVGLVSRIGQCRGCMQHNGTDIVWCYCRKGADLGEYQVFMGRSLILSVWEPRSLIQT